MDQARQDSKPMTAFSLRQYLSLCWIAIVCMVQLSLAADSPCAAVDSAFIMGRYEQVELLVLRMGSELPKMQAEQQVDVNLTAGYALIMLGRETEAREYFRRALDADPATHLDPVRISPKFRTVFDDVKSTYRPGSRPIPVSTMTESRPSAVFINLALPGAGQWMEGRRTRGAIFLGLQLASAGMVIWQADRLHHSSEAYTHEVRREQVQHAYDRYAADTQKMWISGAAAGVIYLAAQADLTLLRRRISFDDQTSSSFGFAPIKGGVGIQWVARW
jgi:hypothetical protein